MREGREEQGRVRAIARGGDAVVETSHGIVLVPGALPGEHVEIVLEAFRRGVGRGRLKRIVRPSEQRRVPPCPISDRCGGCPLMNASETLQREVKLGFLIEACRGIAGAEQTRAEWIPSANSIGYRRRARLAWAGGTLGYRAFRSRRVIDVESCIVLRQPLRQAWSEARRILASSLEGEGEIQLEMTGADRVVVSLQSRVDQPPQCYEACRALGALPIIAGVRLETAYGGIAATWGEPEITLPASSDPMRGPVGGFFQANDDVNKKLVDAVIALAEPKGQHVLELYSGVGNFTIGLAGRAASLVAVERDPRAVEACRANLGRRGLAARLIAGDANRPPNERFDVIVLDPPREGAKELLTDGRLLSSPKRLVYVSCDTATLGRDLALIASKGYRIDRIIGFDMFPQTAHLESVVRLVRA